MPRTRSSNSNFVIKKILEKPPVHHLRSTSQYLKQLNEASIDQCVLSDNSVEDKDSYVKPKRKSQLDYQNVSQKTRTATINKFLQDNQSYYKIEILSGKLRSSSSTSTPYTISPNKKTIDTSPSKYQQPLKSVLKKLPITTHRKKRQNRELTLLNNEAVNFLFPPTPKYDDSDDDSDDNNDLKKTTVMQKEKLKKKVKFEPENDHEENQIIINEDLLTLSPQPKKQYSKEELDFELNFDHIESDLDEYLDMNSIHDEIWYQTFQRQDNFDEDLSMPSNLSHNISLISNELRPQNPNICKENFQKLVDDFELDNSLIVTEAEPLTTVIESTETEATSSSSATIIKPIKQRRKRFYKYRKMLNNPRKSPRKHASTLAILSSLNRNKSQNNNNLNIESTVTNLSEENIEQNNRSDNYDIVYSILKNQSQIKINDCLKMTSKLNNLNSIKTYDDFNVEDILEELKSTSIANPSPNPNPIPEPVQNVNRNETQNNIRLLSKIRRKTNRTGWPNKRRFYARKKIEAQKNRTNDDCLTNSELSESSNTDSNSLDTIIKTDPNIISSPEMPLSPLASIPEIKEDIILLNEQSTTNKYHKNLEKFEKDINSSSLSLKNFQNANSEQQPFVKLQKFNFNNFKSNTRLLRSASFTTSIVNSLNSPTNGNCSYRKLRSARHCFINRTR